MQWRRACLDARSCFRLVENLVYCTIHKLPCIAQHSMTSAVPSTLDPSDSPTQETYQLLQRAMDTLNEALFDGKLPPTLITLQRKPRTIGYYSPARFGNLRGSLVDEIALNPSYFPHLSPLFLLSVISHEQAHQWQAHFGHPVRSRYHDTEWAAKMEEIGLMPSSTGKPGGRRIGQKVSHYVLPEGKFIEAATRIIESPGFAVPWLDRYPATLATDEGSDIEVAEANAQPAAASQTLRLSSATFDDSNPSTSADTYDGFGDDRLPWSGPDESGHDDSRDLINGPGQHELGDQISVPSASATLLASGTDPLPLSKPTRRIEFIAEGIEVKVDSASLETPSAQGFKPAPPVAPQTPKRTDASNRAKYTCADCKVKLWGKPGLRVLCMDCDRPLTTTPQPA